MIRFVVVLLCVALQCLGAAFAGAPADSSSSAPKTPPAEQATPKAPAKDAAKEAAKAGGERIGDWTLFCPEAKDKTKPPSCTLEQLLIDAETKGVAFHLAIGYGPRGNPILVVRAPLGIALVRGLEVTFGAQPVQRAPFNICLSNGCQAVLIQAAAGGDLEGGASADHGLCAQRQPVSGGRLAQGPWPGDRHAQQAPRPLLRASGMTGR